LIIISTEIQLQNVDFTLPFEGQHCSHHVSNSRSNHYQ